MMKTRRTAARTESEALSALTDLLYAAQIESHEEGSEWWRADAAGRTVADKVAAEMPHLRPETAEKVRARFTEILGLGFGRALSEREMARLERRAA